MTAARRDNLWFTAVSGDANGPVLAKGLGRKGCGQEDGMLFSTFCVLA
jgi:hypothetical protein